MMAEASARFGVPSGWIAGVISSESAGQVTLRGAPITSVAGAMGLMQLMPGTYAELRRRYGLGSDPYDPRDSIWAGTAYLNELYRHYGYPALFAAYNAGPKRYGDYLLHGRPLPRATLAYVDTIIPGVSQVFGGGRFTVSPVPKRAPASGLFVPLASPPAVAETALPNAAVFASSSPGLFVLLSSQAP